MHLTLENGINKAAYAFALATLEAGNYAPMAANFVASMVPPLAVGLAMIIAKEEIYRRRKKRNSRMYHWRLCNDF